MQQSCQIVTESRHGGGFTGSAKAVQARPAQGCRRGQDGALHPAPAAAGRDRAPPFPWRRRAGTEPPLLPRRRQAGTEHSHGGGRQGRRPPRSCGSGGGQGRSLPAPVAAAGDRNGATPAPVAAAGGDAACLLLPRQAGPGVPRLPHGPRRWQHGAPSSLPRAVAEQGRRNLPRPPVLPAGSQLHPWHNRVTICNNRKIQAFTGRLLDSAPRFPLQGLEISENYSHISRP